MTSSKNNAIDRQAGLERVNQNEELLDELHQLLKVHLQEVLPKILELHAKNDWDNLDPMVHRLQSASCYTGAAKLYEKAYNLETLFQETKNDEVLSKHMLELEMEIKQVIAAIKDN